MNAGAVRERLARRGLAAHRARGQNFLVDVRVAERIVDASGVAPGETLLEVGTGLGILTQALAARARRVVTLEVDSGLVRALREEGELPENVELVHVDALRVDLADLARAQGGPVRLVANLPYSVASPLLRRLLDTRETLVGWSVLVQRELAARLLALPGSRAYGSLAVLHRLTVRTERALDLGPRCFYPVPKVVSTLVRMTPLEQPGVRDADALAQVERVVRAAFGRRRKTLANALRGGLEEAPPVEELGGILAALGIERRARAETLEPGCYAALAAALRRARGA